MKFIHSEVKYFNHQKTKWQIGWIMDVFSSNEKKYRELACFESQIIIKKMFTLPNIHCNLIILVIRGIPQLIQTSPSLRNQGTGTCNDDKKSLQQFMIKIHVSWLMNKILSLDIWWYSTKSAKRSAWSPEEVKKKTMQTISINYQI